MTYLIVGNNEGNIKEEIKKLLFKLWQKEIKDDLENNKNPDFHILSSENIKSIGIEDIKSFQKEMMYTPFGERVQIGLIPNAHRLTTQAQNSILKSLEESSNTTAYILTTTNEKNILPTVLSRCMKIYSKEASNGKEVKEDDILNLSLTDAFTKIENLSKERENTLELLNALESQFQKILEKKIEKGIDIVDEYETLSKILNARKKVEANGNRRLILESLYLDLTR